jgi:hypothetical protein
MWYDVDDHAALFRLLDETATPVSSGGYPFDVVPGPDLRGDGSCRVAPDYAEEAGDRLLPYAAPFTALALTSLRATNHLDLAAE